MELKISKDELNQIPIHNNGIFRCSKCFRIQYVHMYQKNNDIVCELKCDNKHEFKESLKCAKCGDSRSYVLDFHHVDPKEKVERISRMLAQNVNQEKLEEELKKCVCLCSNCHREFHYFEKIKNITLDEYLD